MLKFLFAHLVVGVLLLVAVPPEEGDHVQQLVDKDGDGNANHRLKQTDQPEENGGELPLHQQNTQADDAADAAAALEAQHVADH